jgi:hypothetical protein
MSVELIKFTPKTEVSIFAVSRFCLSMLEAPVFRVVSCKRIGACVKCHFYMPALLFSNMYIAKDTSVRNMKYVQYIGHIQYLHDSTRRVKGRHLVHNATDHHHRLMSMTAALVLFDILPLG